MFEPDDAKPLPPAIPDLPADADHAPDDEENEVAAHHDDAAQVDSTQEPEAPDHLADPGPVRDPEETSDPYADFWPERPVSSGAQPIHESQPVDVEPIPQTQLFASEEYQAEVLTQTTPSSGSSPSSAYDVLPGIPSETTWSVPGRSVRTWGSRRTRNTITRIDPWSMLKVSVAFYVALAVTGILFGMILFWIAAGSGIVSNIESFVQPLGWPEFHIKSSMVFRILLVLGVLQVIVMSTVNLVCALLYNLASGMSGGLEVTVSERDA
jgi:hypothetical protein